MDKDKQSLRLKHLEFIQAAITRQAQNSFQMKNWTIVVLAALVALYAEKGDAMYLVVSLAAVVAFWGLDGYYLHQERKFRDLYDKVVNDLNEDTDKVVPLSMVLENEQGFRRWICVCVSRSIICIYLPIAVAIGVYLYNTLNSLPST